MILLVSVEQEETLKLTLFSWDYSLSTAKSPLIYKYERKVNLSLLLVKSGFATLIKQYNKKMQNKYNNALLKKGNTVFYI